MPGFLDVIPVLSLDVAIFVVLQLNDHAQLVINKSKYSLMDAGRGPFKEKPVKLKITNPTDHPKIYSAVI